MEMQSIGKLGSDYELIEYGSFEGGHNADVRLAVNVNSNVIFVAKIYRSKYKEELMKNEINFLKKFSGFDGVVNYINSGSTLLKDETTYSEEEKSYIILENCDKYNLLDYMYKLTEKIPENIAKFLFKQILHIMGDLHKEGISVNNVCPDNILLTEDFRLKICGFSSVLTFSPSSDLSPLKQRPNNLSFISPEILLKKQPCKNKSDIFSLGVLFYWLVTKEDFFPYSTDIAKSKTYSWMRRDKVGEIRNLLKKKNLDEQFIELFLSMINVDPMKRPDVNIILQNSYLSQNIPSKDAYTDFMKHRKEQIISLCSQQFSLNKSIELETQFIKKHMKKTSENFSEASKILTITAKKAEFLLKNYIRITTDISPNKVMNCLATELSAEDKYEISTFNDNLEFLLTEELSEQPPQIDDEINIKNDDLFLNFEDKSNVKLRIKVQLLKEGHNNYYLNVIHIDGLYNSFNEIMGNIRNIISNF